MKREDVKQKIPGITDEQLQWLKWEQQYARENAELVALPGRKLTGEEQEFFRRLGLE